MCFLTCRCNAAGVGLTTPQYSQVLWLIFLPPLSPKKPAPAGGGCRRELCRRGDAAARTKAVAMAEWDFEKLGKCFCAPEDRESGLPLFLGGLLISAALDLDAAVSLCGSELSLATSCLLGLSPPSCFSAVCVSPWWGDAATSPGPGEAEGPEGWGSQPSVTFPSLGVLSSSPSESPEVRPHTTHYFTGVQYSVRSAKCLQLYFKELVC